MFTDHNGIKLEISNRKKAEKSQHRWRLNMTLLNNMGQNEAMGKFLKNIFK